MRGVGWRWWWCGKVHQVDGGGLRAVRAVEWVVGGRVVRCEVGWVVSKYIKEQEYLKCCLFLVGLILVIKLLKKRSTKLKQYSKY